VLFHLSIACSLIPIKRDFLEIAINNILQEKTVITIVKISSTELTKNFVPPSFLTPFPDRLIAGYRMDCGYLALLKTPAEMYERPCLLPQSQHCSNKYKFPISLITETS